MAKYHSVIRDAVGMGYKVTPCGQLYRPDGRKIPCKLYGNQKYPTGYIVSYSIPLHKFVAYYWYGEDAFKVGVQTRHINGDTLDLSLSNIKVGTSSENQLDKCKSVRVMAAKKARASQPHPNNRLLTSEQASEIRDYYKENKKGNKIGNGHRKYLSDKYGVCAGTIDKIVRGDYYVDET